MKQRLAYTLMSAVLLLGLLVSLPANATEIYVGYADNLRPTPFFPSPFFGDPTVALFAGQDPTTGIDAGAVRLYNNTASNFLITSLSVQMKAGTGTNFNLWGGFLGAGFTLLPGKNAIFTQTSPLFDFDSSDTDVLVPVDHFDNCSIGPLSGQAVCTNNPPWVVVNGISFLDKAHVLDTGGFDTVNSNPCGNSLDTPGSCNESLQWRPIGTTGIQNPGGGVPEPTSLLLLGFGLAGLAAWRRKHAA